MHASDGDVTVHLLIGPMAAGKSKRLCEIVLKAQQVGDTVLVLKPVQDTRDGTSYVVSRTGSRVEAQPLQNYSNTLPPRVDMLCIDEGQFVVSQAIALVNRMCAANYTCRVVIACLSTTFDRKPWPGIELLVAIASDIEMLHGARCTLCDGVAHWTARMTASTELIVCGGDAVYEPRCRKCHPKNFIEFA